MARPLTVVLDLETLPDAISESIRAVLIAHQDRICIAGVSPTGAITAISPDVLVALLVELGRNVAQVVAMSEVEPDHDDPEVLAELEAAAAIGDAYAAELLAARRKS